jgi:UDP-N-acetylmuramyl pentapeptide phosphotransferase/UDP-N-acetylglucosamine-1-phosphate transferase
VVPFLSALLVSLLVTRPTIALLTRRHVVDVPNARSSHAEVVPRGGGLALLLGLGVGVLVGLRFPPAGAPTWDLPVTVGLVLVLGTLFFAALGLRDDLLGLPAAVRLAAQLVLSAVAVAFITWAAPVPAWGWALTVGVLWVAGYVNAYNFMDGINGISAVAAILAGAWFWLLAAPAHDELVIVAAAALAGAAVGFLPWNAPRARVFLGDVGSYGVGFLIAALALLTAVREGDLWLGLAPTLLYVVDTSWTLARRLARGEPLLEAHRTHVYQRLTDRGLSHVGSTAVVGAGTAIVLVATWVLPTPAAVAVGVAVALLYVSLPQVLARRMPGVVAR